MGSESSENPRLCRSPCSVDGEAIGLWLLLLPAPVLTLLVFLGGAGGTCPDRVVGRLDACDRVETIRRGARARCLPCARIPAQVDGPGRKVRQRRAGSARERARARGEACPSVLGRGGGPNRAQGRTLGHAEAGVLSARKAPSWPPGMHRRECSDVLPEKDQTAYGTWSRKRKPSTWYQHGCLSAMTFHQITFALFCLIA